MEILHKVNVSNPEKLQILLQPVKHNWDDIFSCYNVELRHRKSVQDYKIEDLEILLEEVKKNQIETIKKHEFLREFVPQLNKELFFTCESQMIAQEKLLNILQSFIQYKEMELGKRRKRRQNNRHNKQDRKKEESQNNE